MEEGDYMASMMALWTTPFMPNLLNTAVFLVETSQCAIALLEPTAGSANGARAAPIQLYGGWFCWLSRRWRR